METAVKYLVGKFEDGGDDMKKMRVLRLLFRFCASAESEVAIEDIQVERHNERIELSGNTRLNVQIEGREFVFHVKRTLKTNGFLVAIGCYLVDHPLSYVVVTGTRTLPNGALSRCLPSLNARLLVKKPMAAPAVRASYPSQVLSNGMFAARLLSLFSEDHSEELFDVCGQFLNFLPHDQSLAGLSADAVLFLEHLQQISNPRILKYCLEIVLWRLSCPIYEKAYKGLDWTEFLTKLLVDQALADSADVTVQLLGRLGIQLSPNMIGPLFDIMVRSQSSTEAKVRIAKYLNEQYEPSISMQPFLCAVEVTIMQMTDSIWKEFSAFLWKVGLADEFAEMATTHLDNRFFAEIFLHFALSALNCGTPQLRFSNCIRIVGNGFLEGTTETLSNLLAVHQADFVGEPNLTKELLDVLKTGTLPEDTKLQLCELCIGLAQLSESHEAVLNDFISEISSMSGDRWSVLPSEPRTHQFCGLRNLGATCYLNSVFQQILRIPAFQYLLMNEQPDSALGSLLTYICHSRRLYGETTKFTRTWKGWRQSLIDTAEQQDANEFLNLLVGQLPDSLQQLFRVEIEVVFRGIGHHRFRKRAKESYFSLGLAVTGFSNLHESYQALWVPERMAGANQYTDESGSRDVDRVQKLVSAPLVLVCHLRRFQYDARMGRYAKINSRFTFPDRLEVVVTGQGTREYVLNGAVLHTGELNSGHYTSVLKGGDKFIKFNDIEISEISQAEFEEEAFGGKDETRTAAYLLFYVQVGGKVDDTPILGNFPVNFSSSLLAEIEEDNRRFLLERCAFSEPFARLVLRQANFEQLRNYYFKVFCHSQLTHLAGEFVSKFEITDFEEFVEWMIREFDTLVVSVFINCSIGEIVLSVSSIIRSACESVAAEKAIPLMNAFVLHLCDFVQSSR
jgi:hypothetical protein